jgi:hypothetical protein
MVLRRHPTEQLPSPISEEPFVKSTTISHKPEFVDTVLKLCHIGQQPMTTSPTSGFDDMVMEQRLTRQSSLSVPEELFAQPTTISPTSDSVDMVLQERLTEQLPSPYSAQRKMTTRRYTQSVAESLAPPSLPSAEDKAFAEVQPNDEYGEQSHILRSIPRMPSQTGRAATYAPYQFTARRQSTQPEQFALPESSPSYHLGQKVKSH